MPGTRRRGAQPAEADKRACKTDDCGHPRSEHSLDGGLCYHNEADKDSPPELTCQCTGFSATAKEAAFRETGHATNADLPPEGPTTADDIRHNKDGSLDQRELASATASTGGGEGSSSSA